MKMTLTIFAISLLLTIFLYTLNIIRRHKRLSVSQRKRLRELKKGVLIKSLVYKIIPVILACIFCLIYSRICVNNIRAEYDSLTIYKDGLQVTMLEPELTKNINIARWNSVFISIYVWLGLDILSYMLFVISIRNNTKLESKDSSLLANYHSGKIMYKLSGVVLIVSITRVIFELLKIN